MTGPLLREHERLDDLAPGGRRMIQNTQEFCFSMDAVLLARFPRPKRGWRMLDLGTGAGVIPLLLAGEVAHATGLELNPVLAELAARNVAMNGLQERISVIEGDLREIRRFCPPESFDLVLANPPYYPAGHGKASPSGGRAYARHELAAKLEDVAAAARYALRFRGRFAMVHLPERLGEIMVALHRHRMEPKRLRMVHPKAGRPPCLVLVEAVAGAPPGGLKILPPLVVREADGSYTKEIEAIYGDGGQQESIHRGAGHALPCGDSHREHGGHDLPGSPRHVRGGAGGCRGHAAHAEAALPLRHPCRDHELP